ncbi:DEAD-domain-containing protein [Gloeophyllum trabeum ATCC 11539]|uniref:ATP-dependent RNA helicase n=1 Tax=Gloeophyllum trabeum (strain ATCC 11539 / FP-39264 / Madison 617) TaxID=670483 RepID=S7PX83_GLOTA|nr:DEAD-domain-containing protein [Gloeophyllum trabeum ATCC 11539]EPQ52206.1 DEAD-domain-containing protein [Gloeophyllum trabeum ATCC 11539]
MIMERVSSKRKMVPSKFARKKPKITHSNIEELPWKTVSRSKEAWSGAEDGILELEEVEGVDIVYEETETGRVAKFSVVRDGDNAADKRGEKEDHLAPTGEEEIVTRTSGDRQGAHPDEELEAGPIEPPSFDVETLLPGWKEFPLHAQLMRTIHAQNFTSPTPIQSRAIPLALSGKDVIGVAETGSGKTLAYGLPILHYLLCEALSRPPSKKTRRQAKALVLCPTRELALQVSSHLNACLNDLASQKAPASTPAFVSDKGKGRRERNSEVQDPGPSQHKPGGSSDTQPKAKAPPLVSVAAIVGGMSAQKQRRILDRGVDVLVATPGRLWDILEEDDALARDIKSLRFLVLDEADRMVQAGHFAELDHILRLTLRSSQLDNTDPEFKGMDEESEAQQGGHIEKTPMQTFVFSATMSKDLQRNLKMRKRPKAGKTKPASTLDDLLMRLDFRDPEPEVIDLSPEGGVVSTLKEGKIECLSADKDVYLYYFLLRYPGRSLVFLSSIDGIRRLMPLMELLNVKAFPLHSQLEQRQRLKNLDRFKSTQNSVLLATDIAARGLDIPAVDHVIHYQIPRSADVYVHRNGRTARAMRKGFSMLMCGPDERRVVRALLGSLKREESEIPEMAIDLHMLDKLKARVQLAKQIDAAQHRVKKDNYERNWLKEAAEAMEIELDSDFAPSGDDDEDAGKSKKRKDSAKVGVLKAELKHLLAQPLLAKGISARYITSGSRPIVDDMLASNHHETMLGVMKGDAADELMAPKKKKVKKAVQHEEWNGIEE